MKSAILGLLGSRKFWIMNMFWWPTVWLASKGHVDGMALSAIVASMVTVWTWAHTKTDCAHNDLPQRGQ